MRYNLKDTVAFAGRLVSVMLAMLVLVLLLAVPVLAVPDGNDARLKIWLKADVGVTKSGNRVLSWADQAAGTGQGVNDATAVGSPTLVNSSTLGNKSAIRFNGVDQGFDVAIDDTVSVWNYPGQCTVYAVIAPSATNGVRDIITSGANILTINGGEIYFARGGGENWDSISSSSGSISASGAYVVCLYRDGDQTGQTKLFINGTQNDDGASIVDLNGGSGTAINVGYQATWGPFRYFAGDIAEILVYHEPLNAYGLNSVGYYLADKYGISSNYTLPGPAPVLDPAIENPSPAIMDIEAATDVVLGWDILNATAETSFDVYFGSDADDVSQADNSDVTGIYKGNRDTNSYDPGELLYGKEYYWRVDLVDGSDVSTGQVWSFTTKQEVVVDDFDSYANSAALRAAWDTNAALETNPKMIFGGESASARLDYDTSVSPYYHETARNYSSDQNWVVAGLGSLSLYCKGTPANGFERMYVEIEDADGNNVRKVFFDVGDQWWKKLELYSFGAVDMSRVRKLTIGIGQQGQVSSNSGSIYLDHIALTKRDDTLTMDITCDGAVDIEDMSSVADVWLDSGTFAPDQPAANLLLWYKFDDGEGSVAYDSSGNGHHGKLNKNGRWNPAGAGGGCLDFDGLLQVEVPDADTLFSTVDSEVTITTWVNSDVEYGTWEPWFHATKTGVNRIFMSTIPTPDGEVMFSMGADLSQEFVHDGLWWYGAEPADYYNSWHHYAFTKNSNTGQMKMYRDGELVLEDTGYWPMSGVEVCVIGGVYGNTTGCTGKFDDIRVYDRVLTQGEIQTIITETTSVQSLELPQIDLHTDGRINFMDFTVMADQWQQERIYPHISKLNDISTFVVDNDPFIIVGAQCDIWRSTHQGQLAIEFFEGYRDMNATTVGIGIPWSKVEAYEDQYDFSFIQWFIDQAEDKGLKMGLNLFNSNICGSYMIDSGYPQFTPSYIINDPVKYQRMILPSEYPYVAGGPPMCPNDKDTLEREKKYVAAVTNYLKENDTNHTVVIVQLNNEYYYKQFDPITPPDFTVIRCLCSLCNAKFDGAVYESEEEFMYHGFANYTKELSDTIADIYDLPLYVNSPWWSPYIIPIFLDNCPNLDLVGGDGVGATIQPNMLSKSQLSRNIPFASENPTEGSDLMDNLDVLPYYTIFGQVGIGNLLWEHPASTVVDDAIAKDRYANALYPIKNAMVPMLRARGTDRFIGWYENNAGQYFVREGLSDDYHDGTSFQLTLNGFDIVVTGSDGGFIFDTYNNELVIGISNGSISITGSGMTSAWEGIFDGENWTAQSPVTIQAGGSYVQITAGSAKVVKIDF